MPPPTFSVILPVFNRADRIGPAIGSVLEQSLPAMEVIVVDDGSGDDLAQALSPYGSRITLLRQANAGVAAARNAGAAHATGDWLTFQDSDDLWTPDHLQTCARDLARAADDVVCHLGDVTYVGEGYRDRLFAIKGRAFPSDTAARVEDPLPLVISGMTLQGAAIRRDVFARLGGFDPEMRMLSDTAFFCRLAQEGPFLATGANMCDIRRLPGDDGAITAMRRTRQVYFRQMALRVLEGIDQARLSPSERDMTRRMLSGARLQLANALAPEDQASARALIWQSAREHPDPLRGWLKALVARGFGARGLALLQRGPAPLDRS
jgi:glycosyltransferase involved in cell wall biosynthesis